jgi:hypothetical protein
MKARRLFFVAGLTCCLAAPGFANDFGRHRGFDAGPRDWHGDRRHDQHRRHDVNPGGWQRHWHDHRHDHRHDGFRGGFGVIQPYTGVRPFVTPYRPPVVVVPPTPAFVWYCPDPAGYHPYVQNCYTFWQRVPATRWP